MGFHEGELAVQERAGVEAEAQRLAGMLAPARLSEGYDQFLRAQKLALLTARDAAGHLWTSPLIASPGFLAADVTGSADRLHVVASPAAGDPLERLVAGQRVGLLAIDLDARRRMRLNGWLISAGADGFDVRLSEAYGNCPRYIHPHDLEPASRLQRERVTRSAAGRLGRSEIALIESADTFFLGTTHPQRGPDCSHRGGPAGFVSASAASVRWPDFAGNNMFNSFGNLAVDDAAALLFVDFATGATLHLSGTARVDWRGDVGASSGDTGRSVTFTPRQIVSRDANWAFAT